MEREYTYLSELNSELIKAVCAYLGIATKISNAREYTLIDGKTERLVDLCRQAIADEYISGPAAKDYVVEGLFADAGITLTWFDYAGYKEYPQLHGEFTHAVTILDLLFNCGAASGEYFRYIGKKGDSSCGS